MTEDPIKIIRTLELKHNEYTRSDLARLSRYAITTVSAITVTIGFLISDHKEALLKHPSLLGISIYGAVAALLAAVILEFINAYLFGGLTYASKDLEVAKLNKDQKAIDKNRLKRDRYSVAVDYSRFATLLVAIVGIVFFLIFAICILNNVLAS
jgi:hypothetical protein